MDGNAGVTNASANDSEEADIAARTPMIINMVRVVMNVTMSILPSTEFSCRTDFFKVDRDCGCCNDLLSSVHH